MCQQIVETNTLLRLLDKLLPKYVSDVTHLKTQQSQDYKLSSWKGIYLSNPSMTHEHHSQLKTKILIFIKQIKQQHTKSTCHLYLHCSCFCQTSNYRSVEVCQKCLWFQMGSVCSDPAHTHNSKTPKEKKSYMDGWFVSFKKSLNGSDSLACVAKKNCLTLHIARHQLWLAYNRTFPQHDKKTYSCKKLTTPENYEKTNKHLTFFVVWFLFRQQWLRLCALFSLNVFKNKK